MWHNSNNASAAGVNDSLGCFKFGSLVVWELRLIRDKFLFSALGGRAGILASLCSILFHMPFNIYYSVIVK